MASPTETSVTYEELRDLENEFEDVETEIIRQQVQLSRPLYEKREKVVAQIPHFWPLVFEQAPQDIDEYIQPQDSALLLSSLTSFSVSHFEIENGGSGDPRSVSFRFEFAENEYFEDKVLEKKFWSRRSKGGWTGLVSEPVNIKWKKGKDLTSGLLGLVNAVWEEEKAAGKHWSTVQGQDFTDKQKQLKEQIENVGLGGLSFFAWFGYRGRRVSAKESQLATEKLQEQRQARKAAAEAGESKKAEEEEDDDDDDEEEDEVELEIFPDGDSLALALSDDLWPGAIKYFTQAQEQELASDDDFEDDDDEDAEEDDEEDHDDGPPAKKRKA
ncbi:nucleosome assembly protein [Sordaria brevicollis]|uniref:Nucleosome assembly protein n=1 Tax=Sordaria brevicollis TaxID=83679 RepID=A0AAE0PPE4_SORBR|nr:nucleosome assembly protein [Sordaria brevicollis]